MPMPQVEVLRGGDHIQRRIDQHCAREHRKPGEVAGKSGVIGRDLQGAV